MTEDEWNHLPDGAKRTIFDLQRELQETSNRLDAARAAEDSLRAENTRFALEAKRLSQQLAALVESLPRCPCGDMATRIGSETCYRCSNEDCDPGYQHADGTPVDDWEPLPWAPIVRSILTTTGEAVR